MHVVGLRVTGRIFETYTRTRAMHLPANNILLLAREETL